MSDSIRISSPETRESWEIPVLYEDAHLLALNKPPGLPVAPERNDPARPSLMRMLHRDIARGAAWVRARPGLAYLMNAHRIDTEASGLLLLAKARPVFAALANHLNSDQPLRTYVALVQGSPARETFHLDAPLAPQPGAPSGRALPPVGVGPDRRAVQMRVDPKRGKKSRSDFAVRERFSGFTLLECRPRPARPHQLRAHLLRLRLPVVGDATYGGSPLLLSRLKTSYRLKADRTERPLIATPALHAEGLRLTHPVTGVELSIQAPWPKDLTVAVKYLRRYAPGSAPPPAGAGCT